MKVHNLDTIDSHKNFTNFDCPEYIMFGNIWRIFWLHRTLCLFSLEIYGVERDKDGRDNRKSFFQETVYDF